MRQDGMTFQEIADELGLSHKQLRNWSYRHNCESRNMLKGIAPKPKGRPRKDGQPPKQDMEKELHRLGVRIRLNSCVRSVDAADGCITGVTLAINLWRDSSVGRAQDS